MKREDEITTDDDYEGGKMSQGTKGLYRRYRVSRNDGSSRKGKKHAKCDYFVLDWNHDKFAIVAMEAYASACADDYPWLAIDLRDRIAQAKEDFATAMRIAATRGEPQ